MSELVLYQNIEASDEKVDYDIKLLSEIILEIAKIHKKFSKDNSHISDINLRRKQVRHILNKVDNTNTYLVNNDFFDSLSEYVTKLDFLTIEIDLEYTYNKQDLRIRVKQPESIIYKLGHYKVGKPENGAVPINKCLNDLLGFRISLENFDHNCIAFKEMCKHLGENHRIRYINSSRGDYKATHIYFLGQNNRCFPWELQIWTPDDYQSNYDSHYKYKQEYTMSAQIHKEAFTKG